MDTTSSENPAVEKPAIEKPVRVVLVDDHTILRKGLRQLLDLEPSIEVCGEAGNGEEAIMQHLLLKPDVTLMDINLPGVSGYEATRAILAARPDARILILTNQDDTSVLKRFMDLKIKGFLLKDVPVEDLVTAIMTIHQGGTVDLSPELSEKLKTVRQTGREGGYFSLTEREKQVLTALSKGYSNQQLADILMVSSKTVHNHLYNIYSKIGVKTRSEAIVWAIENDFTQPS